MDRFWHKMIIYVLVIVALLLSYMLHDHLSKTQECLSEEVIRDLLMVATN